MFFFLSARFFLARKRACSLRLRAGSGIFCGDHLLEGCCSEHFLRYCHYLMVMIIVIPDFRFCLDLLLFMVAHLKCLKNIKMNKTRNLVPHFMVFFLTLRSRLVYKFRTCGVFRASCSPWASCFCAVETQTRHIARN